MTARLRKTYRVRRWCGVLRAAILFAAPAVPGLLAAQAKAAEGGAGTRGGFATDRLARIDSLLQHAVDDNRIAGAVGLVLRDGQVVYERAVGWADKEARRRMAALALVEEGKLALTDPVSRYIPAFANTTVSVVRADSSVAAVYQAKGLGPAAGYGWYTADKNEGTCETMERLATVPFVAQPGEAWVYGYSTDVLGCVVERVSGLPLDAFIRDRITGPLKRRDTEFFLSPGKRDRFTAVYSSDSTGHTVRAPDGPRGQGNYVDGPRRSFSGGAGLLSTAHDYALSADDRESWRVGRGPHPRATHRGPDDDESGRHTVVNGGTGVRTRIPDDRPLWRERVRVGRRVWVGRRLRLRLRLQGHPEGAPDHRLHGPVAAQQQRYQGQVPDTGVFGACAVQALRTSLAARNPVASTS